MSRNTGTKIVMNGYSLGTIIGVTVSWSLHQSILWCILHGIFGWLYVLYYVLTR